MKSAVSSYAFVNAKLRARISRLLARETLMQMADARTMEEAVHLLEATSYASVVGVYSETGDILMAELEIERLHRSALEDVRRYVLQFSDKSVVDFITAFLLRFEISAVKNALRLWFERCIRGRSIEDKISYLLRSDAADAEAIVQAVDGDAVAGLLASRPFAGIVAEMIPVVEERRSLFPLEIELDRWYYRHLGTTVRRLNRRDREAADRLIGIEIDGININWVVRMQTYYGEETVPSDTAFLLGGAIADTQTLEAALGSQKPAADLVNLLGARVGVSGSSLESPEEHPDGTVRTLVFLESLLQQLLIHESRRALGGYPFTVGVVLAFFALCRQEARSIITVLNGKYYQLAPSRIGGLL